MPATTTLNVNGAERRLDIDTRTTLLDALREHLGLTGAKKGCDHGQCGSCTVLLGGRRVLACLTLAVAHDGEEVTTIEGLADGDVLHPVQAAFVEHDALQCGYCTPGQILSAIGMLGEARAGWPSYVTADLAAEPELDDDGDPRAHERQPVPLRRLREHRAGDRRILGMRQFTYERAQDAAGALALLDAAGPSARYLGGGTNLVDLMKLGVERPDVLVDVTRLPHDRIEDLPGGGLRIGAAVRNSDLAAHAAVRAAYPLLAQAVLAGASGQLRNMATVGGNLLQRTRCSYFTDVTKPCNKREGGRPNRCPARDGHHRNHAILGHSEACVATHPSDMAVALAALDATVHVEGRDGPRTIPMPGLHRLPGDEPQRDTVLHPGELITAVELPALPIAVRSSYRKVRERASYAFALVSIAAALDISDGVVRDVRIALGAVAHVPWRAARAEEVLRGRPPTEESFAAAADAELAEARPLPGNAYKVPLARNLMVRALADLAGADR